VPGIWPGYVEYVVKVMDVEGVRKQSTLFFATSFLSPPHLEMK
jgi:hypothetical protein